jgi:hypothetical protein
MIQRKKSHSLKKNNHNFKFSAQQEKKKIVDEDPITLSVPSWWLASH